VVDVCATSFADADTYMQVTFESDTFAAAEPPALNESLTPPRPKAFAFLEPKDPEQVRREAPHQAACAASMAPTRQTTKRGTLRRMRCGGSGAHGGAWTLGQCRSHEAPCALRNPRRLMATCVHGRRKCRCKVQGLRHGPLPTRVPDGPVQGLRQGVLPATRAPEEPVQGLSCSTKK
jgi:hypothetical protein